MKKTIKKDKARRALSGGVDSSVVALLINKAIKKNDLHNGRYRLMRKMNLIIHIRCLKRYNLNVKLIEA